MRKRYQLFLIFLTSFLISCGGGGGNAYDPDEVVTSSERIEVPNVTILSDGGEKQVTVNSNCAWVISVPESDSWLSINPKSGSETQTITVSCTENTSTIPRTSVVSITGKQRTTAFKVTQNGREVITITVSNFNLGTPTANSVDYTFSISPVSDDIKQCGVCYSTTNSNPTIEDNVSISNRNGNTVSGTLSSLSVRTTYNICAFVTNSSGTYYSQVKQITTADNFPGDEDNSIPNID